MIKLKFDFDLDIATAHSRLSKKWKNRIWKWSEILTRCADTKRTGETMREYLRMNREEQSDIKDVGGFVGGYLSNGTRKTANVLYRSIVTLDIDYGTADVWDDFTINFDCAAAIYSTHKHTKEKPRLRLLLPANRQMTPAEYEPVCRYWTSRIGIELFDHTTYQLPRLFYWPSTSKDGDFVFEYQDGPAFDVDAVLATYRNPQDVSEWPMSSREGDVLAHEIRKAGDPLEKPGLIGAFCRAYTIEDAIDKFLPDVYEKTAHDGRYTYRAGSVAGGCVTYENKFAFSHHDTDPASRQLCNAFDLVRIHKFGIEDEGTKVTDITRRPSYLKMQDFAAADKAVRVLLTKERIADADSDFADVETPETPQEEISTDWMEGLDYDRKGNIKATPKTLRLIMANDLNFKMVKYDLFSQMDVITGGAEFNGTHGPYNVDDTSLSRMAAYLSEMYGIEMAINAMTDKLLRYTAPNRAFHAVRDFITREKWDGVPRVDTLLVDYLGAADTPLNRAITRKWFAGAVGRALDTDTETGEGIKFDYCLVLYGEQGTGKSTFAEILANKWRGSISLSDKKKEQCESLQRSWIVEIPELKGMRSADMDSIKDLISRRSDDFREAYARKWNKNPRHCVLIGSTNNEHFLKDTTGNRRFWVVRVTGGEGVAKWGARLRQDVGQIWAEAYAIYKAGEPLMLNEDMEKQMRNYAENFNEVMGDPFRDYLASWLAIPLPSDWETYEPSRRAAYYRNYDPISPEGAMERTRVAIHEIVTTCPYPGISKYGPQRIGAVLKSLGWEKLPGQVRLGGYKGGYDGKNLKATFYQKLQIETDGVVTDDI